MSQSNLPVTEELDFAYLLELMPPLHDMPDFAWLPELFSTIGHDKLILLCRYAGGEVIRIPTIEQLENSITALQWLYDIRIKKVKKIEECPLELRPLVRKMLKVYEATNH